MHLGWEAIMTAPSLISEINGLMTELATEFASLAEDDPRGEDIKNELSRLSLLRYQLDKEAIAMSSNTH
jgi:hypothetical protein